MTESLADALPREQARVRDVLNAYQSMRGMPNVFVEPAITMIERSLAQAERVASAGDVVGMLAALEDLRGIE